MSAKGKETKSATACEVEQADDEAVRQSLEGGSPSRKGETRSILPGPPIPPDVQEKLKNETKKPR